MAQQHDAAGALRDLAEHGVPGLPRRGLRALADRLGIPRPATDDPLAGLAWLVPVNLLLAALVLALAFGTILTEPEGALRSLAANAALAQALALGLLARGERRSRLQVAALGVGVIGAVALGWAGIEPGAATGLLDRLKASAAIVCGDIPLEPQRDLETAPSLLDAADHALLAAYPDVQVHVLEGCGHNVLGQAPDVCRDLILDQLARA